MKPTLVILAAGMASRYGSMKQTEGFGPNGETIMDYSVYSAIKAGFGKVVFIIRKDFTENFKASVSPKLHNKIAVDYVFQERDSFVDKAYLPADRVKPWGTGHAMLCAKDAVTTPFAVINADDFYGQDAFDKAADFLINTCTQQVNAIIGYRLANTLSEHGTVSRGVCEVDDNNMLTAITERIKIFKKENEIVFEQDEKLTVLGNSTKVSMNFWCFHPSIFNLTDLLFKDFPKDNINNIKAEFFIPIIAEHFINKFDGVIHVIDTSSQWFGVTYKEDADGVIESLMALLDKGEFPKNLWG